MSKTKTPRDYVVFSLVIKQNAAVAVVELCLDNVIGSLQHCTTKIKEWVEFFCLMLTLNLNLSTRSSFQTDIANHKPVQSTHNIWSLVASVFIFKPWRGLQQGPTRFLSGGPSYSTSPHNFTAFHTAYFVESLHFQITTDSVCSPYKSPKHNWCCRMSFRSWRQHHIAHMNPSWRLLHCALITQLTLAQWASPSGPFMSLEMRLWTPDTLFVGLSLHCLCLSISMVPRVRPQWRPMCCYWPMIK